MRNRISFEDDLRFVGVDFAFVQDQLLDAFGLDFARNRVFDRIDFRHDLSIEVGAVFEAEIAVDDFGVDQRQILHVAEALMGFHVAVDEGDVFRIPAKIFADDSTVFERRFPAVPKSVFGAQGAVLQNEVAAAVEGIISVQFQISGRQVLTAHPKISRVSRFDVFQKDVLVPPKCLLRIEEFAFAEAQGLAFPKILRAFDLKAGETRFFAVPNPGPLRFGEETILRLDVLPIPKGVFIGEIAADHLKGPPFLQRGFPVLERAADIARAMGGEFRSFALEYFVFYREHVRIVIRANGELKRIHPSQKEEERQKSKRDESVRILRFQLWE